VVLSSTDCESATISGNMNERGFEVGHWQARVMSLSSGY